MVADNERIKAERSEGEKAKSTKAPAEALVFAGIYVSADNYEERRKGPRFTQGGRFASSKTRWAGAA